MLKRTARTAAPAPYVPAPGQQLLLELVPPVVDPAALRRDIEIRAMTIWQTLGRQRPELGALPPLAFDLAGRSAGQYLWQGTGRRLGGERFRFNLALAGQHAEAYLHETVAHELAHCAAMRLHRHAGHGAPWRALMNSLGVAAERCHRFATEHSGGRGHWPARCACTTHDLSSVTRNRMQRGWEYRCRRCGSAIVLA